jgi:hypothetical protein
MVTATPSLLEGKSYSQTIQSGEFWTSFVSFFGISMVLSGVGTLGAIV